MKQLFSFAIFATLISTQALAAGGGHGHGEKPKLKPAERYSGRAPIDLSHGLLFNNGTYGASNPAYEKWADSPLVVPGVSDLPYPYSWKSDFIGGLEESVIFVESAIANWKSVTPITKPEAKEYGEKSAAAMEPLLGRMRDAIRTASSASKSDWDKAQAAARGALIEMRATYASLHRNTR